MKETIVFEVIDRSLMSPVFAAHTSRVPVYGMIPVSFATGDQLRVPGEIVERLAAMDWNAVDNVELRALIELAEAHLIGGAP